MSSTGVRSLASRPTTLISRRAGTVRYDDERRFVAHSKILANLPAPRIHQESSKNPSRIVLQSLL